MKKVFKDEEVERRFNALPGAVQEAFESSATARRILEVGRLNGLAIDKIGLIAREVGYLMLGLVPASEFYSDLIEIVGDRERARRIANEINQSILLPIRESLKQLYGNAWGDGIAGAPAPSPTPPSAPRPSPPPAGGPPRTPPPVVESKIVPPKPVAPPPPSPQPTPLVIQPLATMRGVAKEAPSSQPARKPLLEKTEIVEAAKPPSLAKLPEEQPGPTISPRGIVPPEEAYQRIRAAVEKELNSFPGTSEARTLSAPTPPPQEKPQAATKPAQPSPYVVTKGDLLQEIERVKAERTQQARPTPPVSQPAPPPIPTASAASLTQPPAAPASPPQASPPAGGSPKPAPEQLPKPPTPERYTVDPYREPPE